ncbi:RAMP superfamily CRISPR-associated protein [Streptococcus sp. sy018]|uniref:RAMP superfamily CRISPR-associated protein n=1 Tax=Streptococcus sp. sy018 TaxID=2600147 RepID=UPI0011B5E55D|nr:RAMP superfamily CRISPR-associated protein [Streptococcus sp. sy018]TWS95557.1 CRISPR-associated protein Cmr4 [Streptococcus sp. sy018]
MKARIFVLECLTNLHVGSGEVNYNIIDNQVARDAVTKFPTINSSGVKGALRVYFEDQKIKPDIINQIFGQEGKETSQGQLKILSANLLARPIQNEKKGEPAYKMISPNTANNDFIEAQENFGIKNRKEATDYKQIKTREDYEFLEYDLPVIARNVLDEQGISKNLWYEEVVPHKSLFYFTVVSTINDTNLLDCFELVVKDKVIQFGANASIGYGLCKVIDVLQ